MDPTEQFLYEELGHDFPLHTILKLHITDWHRPFLQTVLRYDKGRTNKKLLALFTSFRKWLRTQMGSNEEISDFLKERLRKYDQEKDVPDPFLSADLTPEEIKERRAARTAVLGDLEEQVRCMCCYEIPKDPWILHCGHLECLSCRNDRLATRPDLCPLCHTNNAGRGKVFIAVKQMSAAFADVLEYAHAYSDELVSADAALRSVAANRRAEFAESNLQVEVARVHEAEISAVRLADELDKMKVKCAKARAEAGRSSREAADAFEEARADIAEAEAKVAKAEAKAADAEAEAIEARTDAAASRTYAANAREEILKSCDTFLLAKEEIAGLQKRLRGLEHEVQAANNKMLDAEARMQNVEAKMQDAEVRVLELEAEVDADDALIERLHDELDAKVLAHKALRLENTEHRHKPQSTADRAFLETKLLDLASKLEATWEVNGALHAELDDAADWLKKRKRDNTVDGAEVEAKRRTAA